jgi:hypothetical protein
MVDKLTIMRSFNSHFIEMMTDILVLFPNSTDLKSGLSSFETVKQLNPSLVIKNWYLNVFIPYQDVINNGDISFFCDKDYASDLSMVANANDIMSIIEKIRGLFRSMDPISKEHTMKYIKNLSDLSKIYNGL